MPKPSQPWNRSFPKTGFDWSFRMRAGSARDFFSPTSDGPKILEHKRTVLGRAPSSYLAQREGAEALVKQLSERAVAWGVLSGADAIAGDLRSLSLQLEPDILLVDGASLSFVAGCVCMPSSWSLSHAMGKPVHEVHASVPRLNERIGPHIDRFLRSIPPDKSFLRENWSITLNDELDYHPELNHARPSRETTPEELYLRLEHQLFTSIGDGILMGIRIEAVPFKSIREDPELWQSLTETIRTMPDDVAEYKGMLNYRDSIAEQMQVAC